MHVSSLLSFLLTAAAAAPTVSLSPAEYLAQKLHADSTWAVGKRAEALPYYERLLVLNPGDGDLRLRVARCLMAAGRKEEGLSRLVQVFDSGFGWRPSIALTIATELAARGDTAEALSWIERSLMIGLERDDRLKDQPSFRSLEANPRFRKLAGYAPAEIKGRVDGWRYDLDFFVEEAQRIHAGPHRPAHSLEFTEAVEAVKRLVPELTDAAVAMELQKILALWMADGHSVVYPIPTERVQFAGMLPVSFYLFSDGMFVVASDEAHKDLIGMRVERIGDKPAANVLDEISGIVSRDNNQGLLWMGPLYLRSWDVLHATGLAKASGPVPLRLVDRRGAAREVSLTPAPPEHLNEKLPPPPGVKPPVWQARMDENFWLAWRPDIEAVYVQFNQVQDSENLTIADFAQSLKDTLRARGASTLVIDMRHNNGGDNTLLGPLVSLVVWHEQSAPGHRTFVMTSRNTFSAGQNFLNRLERDTGAIFVGEPSSSRPNFTGESNAVELPWSGLRVSISSRWWQDSFPGDARPYIPVSMPVALSSEDWRTGRDPVMAALTEYLRVNR